MIDQTDRLQRRSRGHLDGLVSIAGIDCDLLAFFINENPRLQSCFPVPLMLQIDPLYADPSVAWGNLEATEANVTRFRSPWRVTRELWERPDLLIQRGAWRFTGSVGTGTFAWLIYEDEASGLSDVPTPASLPPWDEVVIGARKYFLYWRPRTMLTISHIMAARDHAANDPVKHALSDTNIHVGGGMPHLTSLLWHAEIATQAGVVFQPAVLRDESKHATITLWTQGEARPYLGTLAARTGLAHSAYNKIRAEHDVLQATWHDEKGGLADGATETQILEAREAAYTKASNMLQPDALAKRFVSEITKLQSAAFLPEDVPTLRAISIERLEAAATERFAQIKGSVSQQGVDLDPSCIEQANATMKVSELKQIAQINLRRAVTREDLKTAYDNGVAAIEALQVERVPEFRTVPDQLEVVNSSRLSGRQVIIKADHPGGGDSDIPGLVEASAEILPATDDTFGETGTISVRSVADQSPAVLTLAVQGDKPVRFRLQARNICGPADIVIVVTPPPS